VMPTIKKKKKNRLPECTIDLTTPNERMVMKMLALQAPVWYFLSFMLFHWLGYGIEVLPGLLLFYYVYSFESTRQLIFQDDCLRLPGAFRPAYLYGEISKIEIDPTNALRITTSDTKLREISLAGLSREEAAKLWTLFATRFKGAQINPEVRVRLKNWVGQPVKGRQALKQSAELAAQEHANDLQVTLNLKAHSTLSQTFAHLTRFEKGYDLGIARVWLACWSIAAIVYTVIVADRTRVAYDNLTALLIYLTEVVHLFSDFLSSSWWLHLAGIGTCGLVCLMLFSMDRFLRKFHEADRVFIDYLGFTALLNTPTGSVPREHLSWQSIASIKLYGSQSSDAGGVIEIRAYNDQGRDRLPIQIPLAALTSNHDRQLFLEAINAWGRCIDVDTKIQELITPHADVSYTELWFSSLHSAPQLKELTPLVNGAKLSHNLEIEKQLGIGGQAVTYLAYDSDSDNKVVLKEFILPLYNETVKKRMTERFEHDAKLLQSLDHPQVVKLHHYFIEGSRAFLVLEHVEGTTLKQKVVEDGPLSEAAVLELMKQMATILVYLHSRTPPVVHRDFTAENIVINDSGTIKLLDFDVATSFEQETTARASFAGKQNYLPPEQFQGRPCPQSDIYALGATAYYLLTAGEPEPLAASHPERSAPVSTLLDHLVAYCTEPVLQARCGSADELLAKLENQSALISDAQ